MPRDAESKEVLPNDAPETQDRDVIATPSRASRHPLAIAVNGIFILLLIHMLIFASDFLIPVTTAVIGYFILNAPRRVLARIGVPAPVAAAVFTTILAAVLFLGGLALSEPIRDFVIDIPNLVEQAMATLTGPGGALEAVSEAAEATGEMLNGAQGLDAEGPMAVEIVGGGGIATSFVAVAPALLSQIVFAICLLFFLVASGDLFIQKAVQSVDRFQDKKMTVLTIRTIEARLGNYLGAITLINIGLGTVIGLAMWWWNLPSPYMIGIMAATLNFIPFVGAVIGALIAATVAFVTFGDAWPALGVFATYYCLTALEGQLITPSLVGQRLRLNITMVFLSVAFFAWTWSIMGMVVAVPMLIVFKVVCDAVPKLRKAGLFLGEAEGFIPAAQRDDARE